MSLRSVPYRLSLLKGQAPELPQKTGFLENGQLIQALNSEKSTRENPNYAASRFSGFFNGIIIAGGLMGAAALTAPFVPFLFCISSIFAIKYKTEDSIALSAIFATMTAIRMAIESPLKSLASYFATAPNCISECYKKDLCGNYIFRSNCDSCVEKCNNDFDNYLLQSAAIGIPLATIAAGVMGRTIIAFSNLITKKRNENTKEKIDSLIKRCQSFELMPVQPSDLKDLELSTYSKQAMLNSMNTAQLLELRQSLGSEKFKSFTNGILDERTQNKIHFLLNINKLKDLNGFIIKLKDEMVEDRLIWEEIVKRLSPENFKKVEALLREFGSNNLRIENLDEAIASLRAEFSETINFKATVDGKEAEVPINCQYLLEYAYFRNYQVWDSQNNINLNLSKEEFHALSILTKLLKTKEYNLDKVLGENYSLAIPLFILASRFQMEDYLIICHEYLLRNKSRFNSLKLIDSLLTFTTIPFLYQKNAEFVRDRFIRACRTSNYVLVESIFNSVSKNEVENILNSLEILNLVTRDPEILKRLFSNNYNLPIFKQQISDRIINQVDHENIDILYFYSGINSLSNYIEDAFFNKIDKNIFRALWNYAIKSENNNLKQRCLEFLKNQNKVNFDDVISVAWKLDEIVPKEILEIR